MIRHLAGLLAALLCASAALAEAPPSKAPGVPFGTGTQPVVVYDAAGNVVSGFGGASAGVTRTRLTCTLPAYATGGNIVCTDATGAQTTTACAANTACLVSGSNPARKAAEFTNRTPGSTIDVGYSATTAPGNSKGYDGPSATNGQGGSGTENPAHVGAYYAASNTAGAVLVFVQGQ
ncbi:hypothetical protein [Methylobacterium indicum]|uniref:Secreted protein n=1 Tax=Methylobacterium indicum TaxID=1775910 RepID=A0ABR5GTV9_9HYPH|nr:hypothetical protein [Methylobacterium indicum]KMO11813.1 hypothetical protein QR78_28155 [Methylobacterium indicum]KMO12319.1 hypothetical protein QR79_28540 [Methylobacterium indicum]